MFPPSTTIFLVHTSILTDLPQNEYSAKESTWWCSSEWVSSILSFTAVQIKEQHWGQAKSKSCFPLLSTLKLSQENPESSWVKHVTSLSCKCLPYLLPEISHREPKGKHTPQPLLLSKGCEALLLRNMAMHHANEYWNMSSLIHQTFSPTKADTVSAECWAADPQPWEETEGDISKLQHMPKVETRGLKIIRGYCPHQSVNAFPSLPHKFCLICSQNKIQWNLEFFRPNSKMPN